MRRAVELGLIDGPRIVSCGRIVSATSPGGRMFGTMYSEADGPWNLRQAVRAELRRGADFIKVMATGARSVEREDPEPAQLTREELAALVDEAHRLGLRVAAHAEGLAGARLAIEEGVDTIEHGLSLHREPALLDRMAANGQVLVPTLSTFHDLAERFADEWVPAPRRPGAATARGGLSHPGGGPRRGRDTRNGLRLGSSRLGSRGSSCAWPRAALARLPPSAPQPPAAQPHWVAATSGGWRPEQPPISSCSTAIPSPSRACSSARPGCTSSCATAYRSQDASSTACPSTGSRHRPTTPRYRNRSGNRPAACPPALSLIALVPATPRRRLSSRERRRARLETQDVTPGPLGLEFVVVG